MSGITKILIANRGEIACRVMRTARRMGIATVAVYSDADARSLHRRSADEAVHIGASPATECYLVIDKMLNACRLTGADAVHPGYGFLSENPAFAQALKKEGITFIGPAPESMALMGLKNTAKQLMDAAGVPITPGYYGDHQELKRLRAEADAIGYPLLIKAVAGGGGKGMRRVDTAQAFAAALAACQREAQSSFGDDRVLIEKYIPSPRHIEVQVLGDHHGEVMHLFERDCSLQRRYQKIIEEAPAPGMTEAVRHAMTEAAVKAAQAVNYVGAGTIEFIVDGSGDLREDGFWFMEMNTRLQVEHPVTEMVTGLDLVEWQIRIARGERLPAQNEIRLRGHAVEARLYAEDPSNDFLPSVGKLDIFVLPETARVDAGVEQDDEVSIYYDPMLAKAIVHADDRAAAISRLAHFCRGTQVYPVKTNARLLAHCLTHDDFISGNISTSFVADLIAELSSHAALEHDKNCIASVLLSASDAPWCPRTPFDDQGGWRLNQPDNTEFSCIWADEDLSLPLVPDAKEPVYSQGYHRAEGQVVFVDGLSYLIEKDSGARVEVSGGDTLVAPMPGKVIAVNTRPGNRVQAGEPLILMEAMKMEVTLQAPRDGLVAEVMATEGALVADGDILLTLEKERTK